MSAARRRVLVTGASGFVGGHLLRHLALEGRSVSGVSRRGDAARGIRSADIRDRDALVEACRASEPDAIVHLAARTYLPEVLADPESACDVNVVGTLALLEAAASAAPGARVLLVSTCVVYGHPESDELPLREASPRRAVHPYGVQKLAAELIGARFRAAGLDVLTVRPFNHVGPGMDPRISLAHFARQIASAESGRGEALLRVGNLEARRDFLDVRDVVSAYALLLDHEDPPPVLNVASGISTGIGEALDRLVARSRVPVVVERDSGRYRPLDVPEIFGDATLLRTTTGWRPTYSLDRTLDDILEWARQELAG
jgi:GDP-4-dehydro-6-deoxy-D-mannose reductase